MPTFNFSTEQTKVYDLALDLARGDYSAPEGVTKKDLEDTLREKLQTDIIGGKTVYQAIRGNKIALYEIVEEIVNTSIGEDVLSSPFIDSFVEVKNRNLGDKTAFYSEGGLLSVASFAGNHWDTNRQAIDLGEEFMLPQEWIFIHVYDELERFLLGITPMEKLIDKVYKSINKYMQERIYAQFQNVAGSVQAELSATGNDLDGLAGLCDIVQAKGGYGSLTLAGTKGALRKVAGIVPEHMFANSQKEAKAATGSIGDWEGNSLMVIPQVLKSNSFELALSDSQVFIMGADVKPIKLEFVGDTRSKSDTDGTRNNDGTMDFQVQTKMGIGLLLPPAFGLWNFV